MSDTEERMESGGSDGEEEAYEVEKICNHKKNRSGVFLYWIKWKGYAEEENTWEEEGNLAGAEELLKEYKDTHMAKKTPTASAAAGKKKKSGYKSDDSGDESFSLEKIKSEPKAKRGRKSAAKSREVIASDDDEDSDAEQMSGTVAVAKEDHSLLPASEDCLRIDRACRPKKLPPDVPEGTLYFLAIFSKDRKLLIPQEDALKFYPHQLATFLLKKTAFDFPEAATAINGNGNHDSD